MSFTEFESVMYWLVNGNGIFNTFETLKRFELLSIQYFETSIGLYPARYEQKQNWKIIEGKHEWEVFCIEEIMDYPF